jgi:hypothetical protein
MKNSQHEEDVIEILDNEIPNPIMVEKEVELGYFDNYSFEGTGPAKHFQGSCARIHYCSCDCHHCSWVSSDLRLKQDITENVPGLEFLRRLRPVTYKYVNRENNPGTVQTGFIAQEVENVAKEIGFDFNGVSHPTKKDEYYSLQFSSFVAPLVKAVQELMEKNNELSRRIELQNFEIIKLNEVVAEMASQDIQV